MIAVRPTRPLARSLRGITLLAFALSLPACGQRRMVRTIGQIRNHMLAGDYAAALARLRESKRTDFDEQDRVVYWMNEGLLLHLLGQYKDSNKVLDAADRRSHELFTRSIRKSISAAFTSEAATDYEGEDYEKVLLNVFKALNYLGLNDVEGALVEARKINAKLRYYNNKYNQTNVYTQDAFAHWLVGLLFEIERSYDDARISYQKALAAYMGDFATNYGIDPPGYLAEDLVRVARLGGDADLVSQYSDLYQVDGETARALETRGEIVLLHLTGEGPSKSDLYINCWFRSNDDWRCDGEPGGEFIARTRIDIPRDGTVVRVAFPQLNLREPARAYVMAQAGASRARSVAAYPLNAIAARTMSNRIKRIYRSAVIRVITKAATQTAAGAAGQEAGGDFGKWLAKTTASVTMQATEEADKRAWTTLPARIDVARLMVDPGVHDLVLQLPDGRQTRIPGLEVAAGERRFVTHRTLP